MRLPIDENLPPRLAVLPSEAGHDAAHVRDLDAAGASDGQLLDLAMTDSRTIVSADTDFGALLAARGATAPSAILVREVVDLPPPELAELLITCIDQIEAASLPLPYGEAELHRGVTGSDRPVRASVSVDGARDQLATCSPSLVGSRPCRR